jgi:hypothetical protein
LGRRSLSKSGKIFEYLVNTDLLNTCPGFGWGFLFGLALTGV